MGEWDNLQHHLFSPARASAGPQGRTRTRTDGTHEEWEFVVHKWNILIILATIKSDAQAASVK